MRPKGKLWTAKLARVWPYQVALPAEDYDVIQQWAADDLGGCPRAYPRLHDGVWYRVFSFSTLEAAETFRGRFGGDPLDPKHGRIARSWPKWIKPPTPLNDMLTPAEIETLRQSAREINDYVMQKLRETGQLHPSLMSSASAPESSAPNDPPPHGTRSQFQKS